MTQKEILNDKQQLRRQMRDLMRSHPREDSTAHRQLLLALPEWVNAENILLYHPLPGEIDLLPLLAEISAHRFLFSRIEGDELALYYYPLDERDWIAHPLGFLEPDPDNWEKASPSSVDLAIVPGLAFDSAGGRLGRGKGYYDRLLARPSFRGVKIGICWPYQLLDSLPLEVHDIRMDSVLAGCSL
jgi:5-formyltetrahydrofolate cyclo-ligase